MLARKNFSLTFLKQFNTKIIFTDIFKTIQIETDFSFQKKCKYLKPNRVLSKPKIGSHNWNVRYFSTISH